MQIMTRKTFSYISHISANSAVLSKTAKLLGTIVLASFMLISLTSCIQSTGYKNIIEHPGKLELIYYGYQLNNPSQYKVVANGKEFL